MQSSFWNPGYLSNKLRIRLFQETFYQNFQYFSKNWNKFLSGRESTSTGKPIMGMGGGNGDFYFYPTDTPQTVKLKKYMC